MAGNYPGRERRGGHMSDEHGAERREERDARNDARWGRQQDEGRGEQMQGWQSGRREAGQDWQQGGGDSWRRGNEDWRRGGDDWRRGESGQHGSGNYAGDWMSEGSGRGGREQPDYSRGGGFGGPQDAYSRGLPDRDGPGGWRGGLGAMPGALPSGRGGEQYGRGYDWSRGEGEDRESGRGMGQSFRGKGPKGYQRSDERLKEVVCERLSDDHRVDASEISVEVKNGEVTIEGQVSDRSTKYRVEDLIEQCGVKEIHNRLRVQGGGAGHQQASGYTDKAAEGRGAGQQK